MWFSATNVLAFDNSISSTVIPVCNYYVDVEVVSSSVRQALLHLQDIGQTCQYLMEGVADI